MMLQLKDITKQIGTFHLEHINFTLPAGYIMGLVGANGAGKTTLLHLILGLYRPDTGTLIMNQKEYQNDEHEIKDELGTVLNEELFEPYAALQKNADIYGRYYSNYDRSLLQKYMQEFELSPERKFRELSRGEQLKFQFAFALSHHPKLLVLDEPAGNFDPEFRQKFFAVLKAFVADGTCSVILATHLTGELDRIADYITCLDKGKMILSQDIEAFRESYRIIAGETYKINLLPMESIIYMEEGSYGTRAMVHHRKRALYDRELAVTIPTIEEFMYFMMKGGKRK